MKTKERNIEKARKICDLYATDKYTIESCCESEGVPYRTFYSWTREVSTNFIAEVAELYKKADEDRKESKRKNLTERKRTLGEKALAALEKKLDGYTWEEITKEGKDKKNGKTVKVVSKFQVPDTASIIFAATNAFPEEWKNRQNTDVTTNGKDLVTDIKVEIVRTSTADNGNA